MQHVLQMEKQVPLSKVMLYQSVGFLAIIGLSWLDESIGLRALILGDHPYISDFREATFEMLLVLAVWFIVSASTRRMLSHVKYLEGFMRICSWCHHIHFKGGWISFEEFLQQSFDTPTTHGICPHCLAREKAALEKARAAKAAAAAAQQTETPAQTVQVG
jgi:hypothetical protein